MSHRSDKPGQVAANAAAVRPEATESSAGPVQGRAPPEYQPRKFARLPEPPVTGSPVPWLTSIHSAVRRGPYGNSSYRGNCGGYLIKDLLRFFGSQSVLDPMTGSGTCADVCEELDIACDSFDLKVGEDAANPKSYEGRGPVDFVWLHPPYWRMVRYSDDPRCLSNASSLEAFLDRLGDVLENCAGILAPGGRIAVLIGGYSERGLGYIPLASLTTTMAIERGLWPASTEIIRFQHGNTSSRRAYRSSFIPGLHDTCILLRRKGD